VVCAKLCTGDRNSRKITKDSFKLIFILNLYS
jgi:hypothetical protein